MKVLAAAIFLLAAAHLTGTSAQPQKCPSTLIRHAALPSETFAKLPKDVSASFKVSGKFDNPLNRRNEVLASIDKGTTTKLPVVGQPVQGFSGIKTLRKGGSPTGQFLVLTDNGYGNKFNSPDSMLMLHYVTPNFKDHTVTVDKTIFLSDPNKVIPFAIQNEHTKQRYLTGADLDIESVQIVGDSFYVGEEFGPYLIEADATGVVKGFHEPSIDGKPVRSPENLLVHLPGGPSGPDLASIAFNVRRSKGFEGMAATRDGRFLYPMLEGALFDNATADFENVGGTYFLRIFKFDTRKKTWDPDFKGKYPLEAKTNSLGDFNMVGSTKALVIERDDGEGDPRAACTVANVTGCFKKPAQFKRVYLVDMSAMDSNGFVKKLAYIDLLDIQDPNGVAAWGTKDGIFTFPFFTIEGVDVFGSSSIVVENDNNFPSSSTRIPGQNDNNEFIVLDVGKFLTGSC